MRRRSVQLTILIVLILGLSVASLGFRDININVPWVSGPGAGR